MLHSTNQQDSHPKNSNEALGTYRMPRLLSPTHVRKFLLESAKRERAHKFTRVSKETLEHLESSMRAKCLDLVKRAPSKGVTL
ncbi:MAG TPA: hypothetical protein VGM54_10160 [Chthoniobacter sp.]|jgi:hypothetical protein